MAVMIGIDPHKGSHTAVAVDDNEAPLGELRVRSAAGQVERLVQWATPFRERTWAIEGAGGLGYLLAQQLVAAGERVVDVQPKLAARVRRLATGSSNKNDPNDARSVAVAALRSTVPEVRAEDHVKVMKVSAKRHRDLASHRDRIACRLHAVLCELTPGGFSREISAAQATRLLETLEPAGAVAAARHELAVELVADLHRVDDQLREPSSGSPPPSRRQRRPSSSYSGSDRSSPPRSLVTSATSAASRAGTGSPPTTARHRSRSPLESDDAKCSVCHDAATVGSTTPSTWPPSPRSVTATVPDVPTTTARSPKATAAKKRSGRSSGASATPSTGSSASTLSRPANGMHGPGRLFGERLCRQRGRLTPRTPALRPSHSRTRHHPTTNARPDPPGTADGDLETSTKSLLTQRGLVMARPPKRDGVDVDAPIRAICAGVFGCARTGIDPGKLTVHQVEVANSAARMIENMDDFRALDPFFRVIEHGLAGFVDGEHFFELLADDVVFDFIITVPDYPRRVVGRDKLIELYRGYGSVLFLDRCYDLRRHHSPSTSTVVLEYASQGTVVATGYPYTNRYISVVTIKDRKVTEWRDYLDPLRVFAALDGHPFEPEAPQAGDPH